MRRAYLPFSWLLIVCLPIVEHDAAADAPAAPEKERYFYTGADYGTQALYNPLWVIINRGYDVMQIRAGNRDVAGFEYGLNARNVAKNLLDPFPPVRERGTWTFFKEEILPLSWTRRTARWVPNYTLHLLGGGMTYTALREWYEAHGVPAPGAFSATTLLATAFVNETLENKGVEGANTDAIADFYFFDIGAIVLFSFDGVNRFFSRELVLADWSLQPVFTAPDGFLHNQGNYFAAKWALSFYPRLKLFSWFGMATLGGLSYQVDREYSVTLAAGARSTRFVNTAQTSVLNSVDWVPSAAAFVDRNNSPLAILQVSNVDDYFVHLNVYPGVVPLSNPGVGFFGVLDKAGHVTAGVVSTWTLGVGAGYAMR